MQDARQRNAPRECAKFPAALAGAALLGAGIFIPAQANTATPGLKSPTSRAIADGASGAQWIANFAPDAQRQRRISLLRSSMNLSAYRLDFESSIRIKALGWVYRAQDSKNFYVSKIELQKPGQNPVYALVHYAVIKGVEQPRVETPLHVSVPMGGFYKIRFEARGNRFTTWIQDQRVEQWTDVAAFTHPAARDSTAKERSNPSCMANLRLRRYSNRNRRSRQKENGKQETPPWRRTCRKSTRQDTARDKAQQVFFIDDDLIERLLRGDAAPVPAKAAAAGFVEQSGSGH